MEASIPVLVPRGEYGIDNALREGFALGDLTPAGNLS